MDPVLERMAAHRSVRKYERGAPDPELIRRCVAAAQMAATSSNLQGYCLVQVDDARERATLRELCGDQAQVEQAGAFFVLCADQRRHRLVAADAGRPQAANLETFLLGVIDAALFAQNLALAFESQGLGCCFIGGLRNRLPEADALLELPEHVLPLFGLCAGLPAETPERRPRLAPESVWFRGRYPSDAELRAQIAEYDARMAAHYAARGLPGRDWSGAVWRRLARPLREHLRAFYTGKGASLD